MKKLWIILMVLFSGMCTVSAQETPGADAKQQEKLQSLYVAFITQKLELTPNEAQTFWPLHNEFDKEVKGIDINLPELEREQKVLDIKKRYEPRFRKVLTDPQRVDRLFRLHGEFRKKLVEYHMRQRTAQPRPRVRRGV